jgi:hypothetical protein
VLGKTNGAGKRQEKHRAVRGHIMVLWPEATSLAQLFYSTHNVHSIFNLSGVHKGQLQGQEDKGDSAVHH